MMQKQRNFMENLRFLTLGQFEMIQKEQLDQWRKLSDEATAGEWVCWAGTGWFDEPAQWPIANKGELTDGHRLAHTNARSIDINDSLQASRDQAFIAAARTAVPALLDEVQAQATTITMLEEENKALRDGASVSIVYTDGTWKVVSKRSSWEYENDPDYLVTIPVFSNEARK